MLALLSGLALLAPPPAPDRTSVTAVLDMPLPLDVTRDFIERPEGPIGLLPPSVVCPAQIVRAQWSPDGGRLLLVRKLPPTPEELRKADAPGEKCELDVYVRRTGATVSYWTFDPGEVDIMDVKWLAGSDALLLKASWPTVQDPNSSLISLHPRSQKVYLLDTDSKRSVLLAETKSSASATIAVSNQLPRGVVWLTPAESEKQFGLVDPKGLVGPFRNVAGADPGIGTPQLTFDATGREILVRSFSGGRIEYRRLDSLSGELLPAGELRPFSLAASGGPKPTLTWTPLREAAGAGGRGLLRLNLPGVKAGFVVGSDVDGTGVAIAGGGVSTASISPDGTAVVYSSQGVGMVRQLIAPNLAAWKRMRIAWFRARALRDCAEGYLAVETAFANAPGGKGLVDWLRNGHGTSEELTKRLRDPSVLGRFALDVGSERLAQNGNAGPAIGTAATPLGTATVYASGLIDWKPKAP